MLGLACCRFLRDASSCSCNSFSFLHSCQKHRQHLVARLVFQVQIHRRLVFRQRPDVVVRLVCGKEIVMWVRRQTFRHYQDVVRYPDVVDVQQNLDGQIQDVDLTCFHREDRRDVVVRLHPQKNFQGVAVVEDLLKFQKDYFQDVLVEVVVR